MDGGLLLCLEKRRMQLRARAHPHPSTKVKRLLSETQPGPVGPEEEDLHKRKKFQGLWS